MSEPDGMVGRSLSAKGFYSFMNWLGNIWIMVKDDPARRCLSI
ncbi:hypothetical protein [Candidatus Puniceispirillum marinum]|nr:hypothetical protein [Candidatus Puniceispirillum marinum]